MAAGVTNSTMAYARSGGIPWHGLGVALDGETEIEEMARCAGIDWDVELVPLFANGPRGLLELGDYRGIQRTDTGAILGVGSPGYTPQRNIDSIEWLRGVFADGRAIGETAFSLDGGRRVAFLASIPEGSRTIAGDEHRAYMLVTTGHDGSHAVNVGSVMTRVVCQNTLNAALGEKGGLSFRFRHTRSLPDKMTQAQDALRVVTAAQARMAAWLEAAALTAVKADELDRLVDKLFGAGDARGPRVQINVDRFRHVLGAEVARGGTTAYSVLQGVTGYADHARVRDISTREGAERRFSTSVMDGQGVTLKAEAFAFLDELVKA